MTREYNVAVRLVRTDKTGKIINFPNNRIHCLEWLLTAANSQQAINEAKRLTTEAGYAFDRVFLAD